MVLNRGPLPPPWFWTIAARRLCTIRQADRIAYSDGGRTVELGNNDEPMALDGGHAAIVAHQNP